MSGTPNKAKADRCDLTIVVPALNEEGNLSSTLKGLLNELDLAHLNAEVIVFNDGSQDRTGEIGEDIAREDPRVWVVHHRLPKGVGASFIEGLHNARGKYITWFPGDGENEPGELLKYLEHMKHFDIVVPFATNTNVRTKLRRFLSATYRFIINFSFGTSFKYTNGNMIYRTDLLQKVHIRNTGFLCFTEILIKLSREGASHVEVPVQIQPKGRNSGSSNAFHPRSIINIVSGYIRLLLDIHLMNIHQERSGRREPSQTGLSGASHASRDIKNEKTQ